MLFHLYGIKLNMNNKNITWKPPNNLNLTNTTLNYSRVKHLHPHVQMNKKMTLKKTKSWRKSGISKFVLLETTKKPCIVVYLLFE